jgi:SAM-dependent methyltransferase
MAISINGDQALEKLLSLPFSTVLDLGAGEGFHSTIFKQEQKIVTAVTYEDGDYLDKEFDGFDCIWASHVLEHQPNPNLFLKKCFKDLNPNGILAVTVPPLKSEVVGGHITLWNAGVLLYHLILAGFNCVNASVKTYGYNISVIVRKDPVELPKLKMDFGDIETLSAYFPMLAYNGFNGEIEELNWT